MYGVSATFYREIKLKMGFGVVHCCYYDKIYLQLIDIGGLRLQRAIQTDIQTVMEAGVKYFQHQYVKTRGIKYITKGLRVKKDGEGNCDSIGRRVLET